jgi:hypothetical protein
MQLAISHKLQIASTTALASAMQASTEQYFETALQQCCT